jgi:hypothetical protein
MTQFAPIPWGLKEVSVEQALSNGDVHKLLKV